MRLVDCYVGQAVVYNNAMGYNPKYKGMTGTIARIYGDSVRICFDDNPFYHDAEFGTFPECLDPIENLAIQISMSFDEMFGGANEV